MKEIFSQAIQKMKRKDFLDDVIREKTAEASAISGEAAKLRKKNGSRTGNELDLKIYQLNARKSTIEKLIAKCKTEIKALKSEIVDLLTDCYPLCDKPENKAKVDSAIYHAFEGKAKIVTDKEAGGIWGDCDIVGAIVTHDKKKKRTTAKMVKAGVVDSTGVYLKRPQIYVYDYDKKQEDGIFHPETNEYKERVKKARESKALNYIKERYINKNLIVVLSIIALYAVFSAWASIGGFASSCFGADYYRVSIPVAVGLGLYSLATLRRGKRGGYADMLPLGAVLISIVAFVSAIGYQSVIRAMLFPALALVYGVVVTALRILAEKDIAEDGEGLEKYILSILGGVVLAFVYRNAFRAPTAYLYSLTSVIGLVCTAGAILSVAKANSYIGRVGKHLAILGTVVCMACLMMGPNKYLAVSFAVIGGIWGLMAVGYPLVNKDV